MHKNLTTNDTVDGIKNSKLWVWISKFHTCAHCQAMWGIAGWSSSVVAMGWFCYRTIEGKSKQQNVKYS